jgi:hypothetical protein
MDKVVEKERKSKISEVSVDSVDGQVVKKKDQDPLILVDVVWRLPDEHGSVEVKLFGEELKHRLKGHTFFFEAKEDHDDRVRRILI